MKIYSIVFSGNEYRVTVQKIRSESFYFVVKSIEPDFPLYDRYFRIDEAQKSVQFHRSEFHKAIWEEIEKDLDLQLVQLG